MPATEELQAFIKLVVPLQAVGKGGTEATATFLDSNELMPSQQSAYRQHHSTETAVLNVYNDLLMAADSGLVSALCLLDLTAAFDDSTPSIMIYFFSDLSGSSVYGVSHCSGSGLT